ncbi:lipoyl(octanoyl) transferase LipB [Segetibacter sp. 3557_3]|uniref:lipoyl(octanoyl) transferase LipB n=1 Tax=Segetibacter sp. 3557_3 TaxID=2547429 RepID=UPI001058AA53|nr:lipoyl(octanoyl) transferase LipB [Segetibacter sp. 3557_3]TDH29143.1 lipoyl(octanoyl) transferase LipB [Segetibacter sp. 3557_3]
MNRQIHYQDLGSEKPYQPIWDYQEKLLQQAVATKTKLRTEPGLDLHTQDHLLFVEHSPVYTLGKSGDIAHVLISEEAQKQKGIQFFRINRGGDITFHGPGQLVGYPILDLEQYRTDIGWYLRSLEEIIILTLGDYGLKGDRSQGETGVWLDPGEKGRERKICAMGIRCSRWITMHGFALNVNTDLSFYDHIIPCGIRNKQVTSLQRELGTKIDMEELKARVLYHFSSVFGATIIPATTPEMTAEVS